MLTKVQLAKFLFDELEKSDPSCWSSLDQGMTYAGLDGHFDLEKVAEALMKKFSITEK
jgi:hypothetical protein